MLAGISSGPVAVTSTCQISGRRHRVPVDTYRSHEVDHIVFKSATFGPMYCPEHGTSGLLIGSDLIVQLGVSFSGLFD